MKNRANLLYRPEKTWKEIEARHYTIAKIYFNYLLLMAAIPVGSAYIGSVYIGWNSDLHATSRLTPSSAGLIAISAYVGILFGAYVLAAFVHWMARTYGSNASRADCFALVVYSSFPLFIVSVIAVYPILWLDTLIVLAALAFAIKLLFVGTPIMMKIDQDRGFLFTNSILAVGMVLSVAAIAISVLFWGLGIGPEFSV